MKYMILMIIGFLGMTLTSMAKGPTVGMLLGTGGLGDQSFNDMTFQGLAKAEKEFKIRIIMEQPGSSESAREESIKRLIEKQASLIVANGWENNNPVQKMAKQYPQQHFLINDVPVEGLPNVASTVYGQHEGSFLAGALAGWMTKSMNIGFIGGVDIPVIHAFRAGFEEGVQYANPTAKVLVEFVSRGNDFSGFRNPPKGYQMATDQYQQGNDIIFSVAGLTGNGIIQAAQKQKKWVIGVDSNQDHLAKGHVLTSMMKRLDQTTFREIEKFVQGNFQPGVQYYGLKEGGVSLTPMEYSKPRIPPDVLKKLEAVEEKIISGKIKVTDVLTP